MSDKRTIPELIRDGDGEFSSAALLRNGVIATGNVLFAADRVAAAERIDNLEAENERLRLALREIVRMTAKGADAPMTAERWLDRIDETAINALSQEGGR